MQELLQWKSLERKSNMSKEQIFIKLTEIFNLVVPKEQQNKKITPQTELINNLGLSSVSFVYMVFAIEKEFKINLSKVSYDTFKTVQDVVDIIYYKIN